ncbi:MAG: hypothetical protein M5U01_17245 [Ardenticatenaceae bacterium]|nr:hypothetical protein [Ardenticatenaceae bacterium]
MRRSFDKPAQALPHDCDRQRAGAAAPCRVEEKGLRAGFAAGAAVFTVGDSSHE